MAAMKFKFTIQDYQTDAVESVVNVFEGQPFNNLIKYRMDAQTGNRQLTLYATAEDIDMGFANEEIKLSTAQLLENIKSVQARYNIKQSKELITNGLGMCSLDIEMETGTGKTYVYIKTMFELNKRYGWNKFIVVVPSIAIREGVKKSFETTQQHFLDYYGVKARYFVYDSKNLGDIDDFRRDKGVDTENKKAINVMIINIQAFNARGKDARRITMELDEFGSKRPIDAIKAIRPILILDEPQKMGGSATQESLKKFGPLFCLNYSATHKEQHNLVYVLDALDAYNKKLVKQIEVKGFDLRNLQGTQGYLYLDRIRISGNSMPIAYIELEIKHKQSIKREIRKLGVGDDLYAKSNNMKQYQGYRISEINSSSRSVTFTNGETICTGEVIGDRTVSTLRRMQIRETIKSHFDKEQEMFLRGIKTLSLFFIDEVAKYRKYNENGDEVTSEYEKIFAEEYLNELNSRSADFDNTPDYKKYLESIDVNETHQGYFSIDKQGHMVDSSLKSGSDESDDISAYDLIMKDKERLLSFENPVRFIFSHSALREGWDNPNVFQICTLKQGGSSTTQKRQEVGRGLRLCVNQDGVRMDRDELGDQVQEINRLTVIASEGYSEFVSGLQKSIREDLYNRPTEATVKYFEEDQNIVEISHEQAWEIHKYLLVNDYIDSKEHITDKYREDLKSKTLPALPESCQEISEDVHKLIQGIFNESNLANMIKPGGETTTSGNPLNANFHKKEFQTLWGHINHKYVYTVDFDSKELIRKAIDCLNKEMYVSKLQYRVTTGRQGATVTPKQLAAGTGFSNISQVRTVTIDADPGYVKYDLIGEIAAGTKLTRKTVAKILGNIEKDVFKMFQDNPEEFIMKAIQHINAQKATTVVEHITYNEIEGTYDSGIFAVHKNLPLSRVYRATKNVQDYVPIDGYARDGESVERKFAQEMDANTEVCVYAKLPKDFFIPTPFGDYSPDWAIAFNKGKVKHIFFIAETKGTMDTLQLREVERAKINCAAELFKGLSKADIVYKSVATFADLWNFIAL